MIISEENTEFSLLKAFLQTEQPAKTVFEQYKLQSHLRCIRK